MDRQSFNHEHMLAAMSEAGTYPHPAEGIIHLRTHISDVFLAGPYAYKMKKPVNLGFLDFTTLLERRHACEDEVRLNRRLAPQIYLGVVPILWTSGHFAVGSETDAMRAEVVDYAVKMVRMPQDGLLNQLATTGLLSSDQMRDIARQLACFHSRAERGPDIERYGSLENISHHVRQNFAQIEPYIERSISHTQFDEIRTHAERFMRDNATVFSARVDTGHIVDGHGDLHLGNMCLYGNAVIIFDCVEFSQKFRSVDVISDIAFLTMDLDAYAQPQLGNCFINEYLQRTDDYMGLAVLDFYQAYRACVRGKVISFLLDDQEGEFQSPAVASEASRYFAMAQKYTRMRTGGLLITCGPSASGKTTVALQVAGSIGGIVVRSDAVRKHLAGMPLEQAQATPYGQGLYSTEMTHRTYQALLEHARAVIASGRWAILDATYLLHAQRLQAAMFAQSLGIAFGIIHCDASLHELERRLERRSSTQHDISDATHAVLRTQIREFEPPERDAAAVFRWTGSEDPVPWINKLAAAG